jgi:flavin reductase (DIM6/NTAB) family NADH-FMN oxidoreductase RutF
MNNLCQIVHFGIAGAIITRGSGPRNRSSNLRNPTSFLRKFYILSSLRLVFGMINKIINRDDLLPRVLVTVRAPARVLGSEEIRDNLGVIDWHMPVSIRPMKYSISVKSDDSLKKMISRAGNFVVNFLDVNQESIVLSCENHNGLFVDLFEKAGINKAGSDYVESPRIKEAKVVLECEVEQELDSGDHTIFIGRVVGPRV